MGVYTTNIIDEMDTSESPALTSMINSQLNERFLENELKDSVKEQYIDLKNLGYNFFNDYTGESITPELLMEMIEYIDEYYIGIEYSMQINDGDRNTFTLGPMIYEIFCIDMVNFILPNVMKNIKTKDPNDIKYLEPGELRFEILKVAKNTLEGLEEAKNIGGGNSKIANEIIKYSYCMNLFDNDLEDFIENYIIPVCNNYNTLISNTDV